MARTYSWNAYETKLTSSITDSSTTISVESTIGLKGPGYLVLAPEDPALREYIMFATVVDGTTLNLSPLGRGLDGSTAGAQGHDSETILRAVSMAQMFDDLWEAILPPNGVGQELQDHVDDPGDPHSLASYLKLDEATSLFVNRSGDSMTGFLVLHADPTNDLHAVTKQFVDAIDPTGKYLLLTGGTLTGDLAAKDISVTKITVTNPSQPAIVLRTSAADDDRWAMFVDQNEDSLRFYQTSSTTTALELGTALIEMNRDLTLKGNSLLDVADPTSDLHVGNRGYSDARYLAIGDGFSDADAVAAMGAVGDANDLNHNRYTDAEAVAAVGTVDTNVALGGASVAQLSGTISGTGWNLVHTFSLNPPNAWGTARVVVRVLWQGAGVSGGTMQMEGHANIAGNAGVDVYGGSAIIGDDPVLSMVHAFDTTADPVAVQVYLKDRLTGGGSVTNRYVDIDYAMYRIS